jgi:integration host factor subunit alpha
MTKAELIDALQMEVGLSRKESVDVVEQFFESVKSALLQYRNIKLSRFGSFEVRYKKPRVGRNPHTGASMLLKGRHVLVFKPSLMLREAINGVQPKTDTN